MTPQELDDECAELTGRVAFHDPKLALRLDALCKELRSATERAAYVRALRWLCTVGEGDWTRGSIRIAADDIERGELTIDERGTQEKTDG